MAYSDNAAPHWGASAGFCSTQQTDSHIPDPGLPKYSNKRDFNIQARLLVAYTQQSKAYLLPRGHNERGDCVEALQQGRSRE